MPMNEFWEKTLGVIARAQDEIVKVSQFGKTQIDRSFLVHERNKLFSKLGQLSVEKIKEGKISFPEGERLAEQIERLNKRIEEMGARMKDLTKALSHKLEADSDTEEKKEVSSKKIRIKKKKSA